MYTTIYVYDFPSPSSKLSSRSLRVGNKELLYTTQLQTALYKASGERRQCGIVPSCLRIIHWATGPVARGDQGTDTPVPVPAPGPDLSGDGDGASVPDLAGDGDAPPSPSPICPGTGTLPRPRPRFAEIGDQAVVLEYPKGVEGFSPGLSHNSHNSSTLSDTPFLSNGR